MHLLVRDARTLDDDAPAVDLAHAPAELVFLSFTDSDLSAAAAGWEPGGPSLRLASLAQLRHPLSVDLYIEQVIVQARCVVVRVLGGLDYWRYGAEELSAICRAGGIALALLPGDERADPRLTELSTVSHESAAALDAYFAHGGPANVAQALRLAARLGGLDVPAPLPPVLPPRAGEHALPVPPDGRLGLAVIVFYRAHLLAGDHAPVGVLAHALHARGLGVRALYVTSLKDPEAAAFAAERLRAWRPAVVLNATAFSAGPGTLDAAGAPVLQLVLAGTGREAWAASSRGLSQTDLAMQVVLPELDGRLLTTAIAFKAKAETVPGLSFTRTVHRADPDGIALAADRAAGWARLAATPPAERRIAIILSDYPGGGQTGHAVGLDTFASLDAIEGWLPAATARPSPVVSLADYRRWFAQLPEAPRGQVLAAWGDPTGDFPIRLLDSRLIAVVQPDRGHRLDRKSGYHDPDLPPTHAYIAFYFWLRHVLDVHAIVHLGTHGTLEWLPGKAAAVSAACMPAALTAGIPVIYPFIVNNPGEAAAAKRRLGAVTIGHMTPPLMEAGVHGAAEALERLFDDYAAADGLDRRRTALLRKDILEQAEATGLLAESGAVGAADEDSTLARLDAWLCDVKELRIRDGLHVFGAGPCGEAERAGLLAALDGRFVPPGPAGAPSRARRDVLPTGRNLTSIDPRAIPTPSAVTLAEAAASELLRRHRQDHGDWPRALVMDLWGSTTMRTGGEDFALALLLLGVRPCWDDGSARVSGFEVMPLALLDRPRVDVTLRISGLFRDAFPGQIALFDQACRAVAEREEAADFNPLAAAVRGLAAVARRRATIRIFGAAPGDYGAGVTPLTQRGAWQTRADLGAAYLATASFAYGRDLDGAPDAEAFAARVAAADAFVHIQDHAESDLLDSPDYAAHEGGFAAAAGSLGAVPALYHLDTSRPEAPRARNVLEEVARIVRGRAANPAWLAGMRRHGYRGAAEIARTLDALHAFAATLPARLDRPFDLVFDATLGDPEFDGFLRDANPDARAAMASCFRDARDRGLWRAVRNDVTEVLGA